MDTNTTVISLHDTHPSQQVKWLQCTLNIRRRILHSCILVTSRMRQADLYVHSLFSFTHQSLELEIIAFILGLTRSTKHKNETNKENSNSYIHPGTSNSFSVIAVVIFSEKRQLHLVLHHNSTK